ncbi:MAG: DNA mismatch repair endonuclease MutL [Deltaproteobacteria bacterium]|nr:DNA mismatch repair endonuclease MutL [Deltaproteobacteria bacterium]
MTTPSRITRLDPLVANQIAAGEVVERPSSAVKELVENALDAGATRIAVELDDGGKARIEVQDNGSGIRAEDAELAFARHATSKLHDAGELARVLSYGFRGEALASIAAVARVALETRPHDDEIGVRVEVEGSATPSSRPMRCAAGTRVIVRDLFFNVPARAAFLRAAATELGHVIRLLEHVGLARPSIHLLLSHNGKRVLDLPARQGLAERAADVFGAEVAAQLYPISAPVPYAIEGLLSGPGTTRGSGSSLHLVVDGRPVRDRTLAHSVQTAYAGALERGRYPLGVLHLRAPPGTVDVNVHPAKAEVRFASSRAVHAAIGEAIGALLAAEPWFGAPRAEATPVTPTVPDRTAALPRAASASLRSPAEAATSTSRSWSEAPRRAEGGARGGVGFGRPAGSWTRDAERAPVDAWASPGERGRLSLLGQIGTGHVAVAIGERLGLLEPHALDAFLLRRSLAAESPVSESLIVPRLVALEPAAAQDRLARSAAFERLGFVLEAAGSRAVLVRAGPAVLPRGQVEAAIVAMNGADDVAALACCAAVRTGARIDQATLQRWMAELSRIDPELAALRSFAPHGTPAALLTTNEALVAWLQGG